MSFIEDVLRVVPEFDSFMSVSELYESSRALVSEFKDVVELVDYGDSRVSGFPVEALIIRGGEGRRVLAFAFPHPNEPVGSLTLEFLSRRLASDRELLKSLDATWIIVKVADVFGAKLNEGWFKGAFSIQRYALNYYRPPAYMQVEWSFPIEYKSFKWGKPVIETKALMKIIDEWKPTHIYSLHNSFFTGTYYYISRVLSEDVLRSFRDVPRRYNVPIHMGEAETPYMEKICDAVFRMPGLGEMYDWLEKYLGRDPSSLIEHGGSSYDYARRVNPEVFELVCEVPYIYDYRLSIDIPIGVPRRELLRISHKKDKMLFEDLEKDLDRISKYMSVDNPFYEALSYTRRAMKPHLEAEEKWIETAPELSESATVAQAFDTYLNSYIGYIFRYGLIYRAIKYEMAKGVSSKDLEEVQKSSLKKLENGVSELNSLSNYYTIPIRHLVSIQLAAILLSLTRT
jgi:hypothetical protein